MALTLPSTYTTTIANVDGNKLDLGATLGQIVPSLAIPSFLEIAKNTSGVPPIDKWQSMRFFMQAKHSATMTYRNGQMVVDPASLISKSITIEPVQLTPAAFAEKIELKEMDRRSPHFENALSTAVGNWISTKRIDLEIALLNKLVQTSNTFNEKIKAQHANATTFANGAHYEALNITNFDEAKQALKQALNVFENIGLPNSLTAYDANNKFTTGILRSDILCLVSYDFLDLITSDKALLANDIGYNEIFKEMGVRRVMGVDMMPLQTMPRGVHFILITTGVKGTFAYESVAGGLDIYVGQSEQWHGHTKAEMQYSYIIGIVNEQYCVVATQPGFDLDQNIEMLNNDTKVSNATRIVAESFSEDAGIATQSDDISVKEKIVDAGKKVLNKVFGKEQSQQQEQTQQQE